MIIPDINLLIYAYNQDAPHHESAKKWWQDIMNTHKPVAIPWVVILGFVRLITHPSVLVYPLKPRFAMQYVESWLSRSHVQILEPGPRHFVLMNELFTQIGVAANLTTDAHLAAIAIEYQCELHSNDSDFSRFPGLHWHNPLKKRQRV